MRFLRADKVFDGVGYLVEGTVLVLDHQNLLREILAPNAVDPSKVEKFEGIITPGFVNSHCHLELSHLRGKISKHNRLSGFAIELMQQRPHFAKEIIAEQIDAADVEMYHNGIVAVGDICNTVDSFKRKTKSKIFYHSFIELIGLNPNFELQIFEKGKELLTHLNSIGLKGSFAPHAPYSVSQELAGRIAQFNLNAHLPTSIHNQESAAETDFFMGQKSEIHGLYDFLKLDISYFKAPEMDSLSYLNKTLKSRPRIFVHNTFSKSPELKLANDVNTYWCFCPAANLYIENRLPDFENFRNMNFCIGTDSLASNDTLDVLAEANLILQNSQVFDEIQMLQALTYHGAKALGIENEFGKLLIGKNTGLNLIHSQKNKLSLIKKIC